MLIHIVHTGFSVSQLSTLIQRCLRWSKGWFTRAIRHSENKKVTQLKLSGNEVQIAVPLIVYCTAAFTSLSDSRIYITFLVSEWRVCTIL